MGGGGGIAMFRLSFRSYRRDKSVVLWRCVLCIVS